VDFPTGLRSFFAREISEPTEHVLRVVIAESSLAPPKEIQLPGTTVSVTAQTLFIDKATPSLMLEWQSYVAYSVENERFGKADSWDTAPRPLDAMLQARTETAFLNYVSEATFASDKYLGVLTHWQLFCENHIINVVSDKPPFLQWLPADQDFPIR
jgi:hypothetical protein